MVGYLRLPLFVVGYLRLPLFAVGYLRLPLFVVGYLWLLSPENRLSSRFIINTTSC